MNTKDLIAKAQTTVNASTAEVWDALINPDKVKQYMFGADVKSDFKPESKIVFTGTWEGKPFKERGYVLEVEKGKLLRYNTFNPASDKLDIAENYHTITIELKEAGYKTEITLSQDNNESEEMRLHSQKNWEMVLEKLKNVVEKSNL
jgi:uncharacterized protein YndB with AHSA1/START domain